MRIALFYHSLVSDWNHGNAHFLRGIALELQSRGHQLRIFEPEDSWSRRNLLSQCGPSVIDVFQKAFPTLSSTQYRLNDLRVSEWLEDVELVLVHEWNEPGVVAAIGHYRRSNREIRVFFHDTHHRAVSAPEQLARFDLTNYDGVLAYGTELQHAYQRRGWGKQVFVWHEAADVRTFYPRRAERKRGDVVWIGNWGDEERTEELREFFLSPVTSLQAKAQAYGVRYPQSALRELEAAGISYGGWLPNFEAPNVFAQFEATVHIPRRPYARQLPGIPTIRPFEALACGIPLISAPWQDTEGLFRIGQDFLVVRDGLEMEQRLRDVLSDPALARELAINGLETIRARHTCAHRVDELLAIYRTVKPAHAHMDESMAVGVSLCE
jgi:spore maturation protein CgeB